VLSRGLFGETVASPVPKKSPTAEASVAARIGNRRIVAKGKVVIEEAAKTGDATLAEAIQALCKATVPEALVSERDAETRRNAVTALVDLAEELGVCTPRGIPSDLLALLWKHVCLSTRDYATDTRGDVGSWVRVAAADSLCRLVRLLAVVPTRLALGLEPRGTVPYVGRVGETSAASIAARLVRAQPPGVGCRVKHAEWGMGTLVSFHSAGSVAIVDFSASASASWHFAYGSATVFVQDLVFVDIPAADAHDRPGSPGFPANIRGGTIEATIPKAAVSPEEVASAVLDPTGEGAAASEAPLTRERATEALGCLLRLAVEKQDRVRSVAGRALSRLLHDNALPEGAIPAEHLGRLRDVAPPAVNAKDEQQGFTLPSEIDEFERVQERRSSRMHDNVDDVDEDDATEEAVKKVVDSEGINYAAPDSVFPKLVSLLYLPCPAYLAELCEGMCLAVGGLSESVVKSSGASLTAWAREAGGAKGDADALEEFLSSMLVLLRGRTLRHEAGGDGDDDGGGESRPHEVAASLELHARESLVSQATRYMVESRLVVPVLRTLETLLSEGDLAGGTARLGKWAKEAVPLIRYRIMKSREPVRVMTAASVLLGMVPFPQPVGAAALRTVLDLLGHPFPKVRRVAAEKLFSTLMVFEDLFHSEPMPDLPAASASAESSVAREAVAPWLAAIRELSKDEPAVVGFWSCNADEAMAILSSNAWDGPEEPVIAAREKLYVPLGLALPKVRMGAPREEGGRWGYPDTESDIHTGSAAHAAAASYMALVQEVGY
jgi:hypothetical protein